MLLWYNSGGTNNSVTEKPRGCLADPVVRKAEFKMLHDWGIKGVKIDFFHSDKQDMMQRYLGMLEDAAEYHLLVNFHGCTMPRGWSRTYPHLMSMEAVRGAECYTFAKEFPQRAPQHNTILVFTRNVVGPMDYTPVTFSHDRYPHITTNGHELALSVVFESGWQHFADRIAAYRELPEAPKLFLRNIPVAWDDIRFLDGFPGQWAAVARRKGSDWYIGIINGVKQPRTVEMDLSFLAAGSYKATIIQDAATGDDLTTTTDQIAAEKRLTIKLRQFGGAVVRLTRR